MLIIAIFAAFIIFFVVYHIHRCKEAEVIINQAMIEYPELKEIFEKYPEYRKRFIDQIDSLPYLIDLIIEDRLSN